jgi:HEAT repeat protein
MIRPVDTRTAIEQAKARGDRAFFERALDETRGVKALLQTLEQLGRLPTDFDPAPLMRLATHPHDEVRTAAVKALSRLENPALPILSLPTGLESCTLSSGTLWIRGGVWS